MHKDNILAVCVMFLAIMFIFCMGGFVGSTMGTNDGIAIVRQEAIENNAAEWQVDAKTGETTFVWLTEPEVQ